MFTWIRGARLRVQVGRILVGEAVVRAVLRELATHIAGKLAASEEETKPELELERDK